MAIKCDTWEQWYWKVYFKNDCFANLVISFCAPLSICPTGKKWQKTIICGEIFHNIYFPEEIDIFHFVASTARENIWQNVSKICFLINFVKAKKNAQHLEDTHRSEQTMESVTNRPTISPRFV